MAVNPNEDTEFNDALRKHGILPPREPTPPSPSPPPSPTLSEKIDDLSDSELKDLGEDMNDEETGRLIEKMRRQRIAEIQRQAKKARFGRVYPIGRDDYTREVTEASKEDEEGDTEGKGTGVVCFLYKDGIPRSDRTFEHIRNLARRYPRTKFVSIVGDKCIPNLPDSRIPMLIVYKKGQIINQIIAWAADKERRLEELEAILMLCGAIIPELPSAEEKHKDDKGSDAEDEDDDDDDGPSSRMKSRVTMTNKSSKNVRRQEEDSDSDFDL
ncbi:thioredoxin-like protein [Gloeophyllum trabeum ATCC 11539]|uniref:Thioredoxin-like protein n=1 Tax=Gloeophyllum trabeum (strain ATCC 11539 / FP-39264 / Madison 617) TaxID=670483 RepID=S7QHC1_GLOTA|nr:thioredoxin-like protein [Gloeophyllum trabeum ATCC 11539]EPQ58653.1 thioredoxin-like protein [Gloeophyllum trabeum ATCC 11539]